MESITQLGFLDSQIELYKAAIRKAKQITKDGESMTQFITVTNMATALFVYLNVNQIVEFTAYSTGSLITCSNGFAVAVKEPPQRILQMINGVDPLPVLAPPPPTPPPTLHPAS